jgi:hypothetical protein
MSDQAAPAGTLVRGPSQVSLILTEHLPSTQ